MLVVTLSDFRSRQSECISAAQREPVGLSSRGVMCRAIVVSVEFYNRALVAIREQEEADAEVAARQAAGTMTLEDLDRKFRTGR